MKSKERILFELVSGLYKKSLDDNSILKDISIYEDAEPGSCHYRIYHSDGYCWDISERDSSYVEYADEKDFEDGLYYSFYEAHEGFKECGQDKAIEILSALNPEDEWDKAEKYACGFEWVDEKDIAMNAFVAGYNEGYIDGQNAK